MGKFFMRKDVLLCLVVWSGWLGSPLGGRANPLQKAWTRFQYTQIHMGVQVRILLYAPDEAAADRAAAAAFRRFEELDQIMSDYRPSSELMRLCAASGGPPIRVSEDLFRILRASVELSRLTGGGFDVTVGPEVALWRRARMMHVLPDAQQIASARKLVGWQNIILDDARKTVRLALPGMKLDLGGIAKGYADDAALVELKRCGIRSALVEAGGDIALGDPPPGEAGWRIAIPNAARKGSPPELVLHNCGISTSGDTEQYLEIGGKRYSHIVDPHTGMGLTDRIEVTVIAPNATTSDGLSTAISVIGEERGRSLARRYHASIYVKHAE
ncbi:MAG: FAD:protein FMN transferase [Chthonomonadales bacterium]